MPLTSRGIGRTRSSRQCSCCPKTSPRIRHRQQQDLLAEQHSVLIAKQTKRQTLRESEQHRKTALREAERQHASSLAEFKREASPEIQAAKVSEQAAIDQTKIIAQAADTQGTFQVGMVEQARNTYQHQLNAQQAQTQHLQQELTATPRHSPKHDTTTKTSNTL